MSSKGLAWRKARASFANGNCLEAATAPGVVLIRDSKAGPDAPLLSLSPSVWQAFTDSIKSAAIG